MEGSAWHALGTALSGNIYSDYAGMTIKTAWRDKASVA